MPKTTYFGQSPTGRDGVDVTWWKTKGSLSIGGWYDSCVGIEAETVTLGEFFERLGITEKDCRKAFKKKEKKSNGSV